MHGKLEKKDEKSKEFDNLGYMFILMFFASLLVSILNWTNLGTVVASWLISFMSNLEFTGIPLIVTMFLVIVIMSFLIPDAITKWTLASPILVPLFMKANITPDFTQFIFKAADSIGKGLTPLFIYFIVLFGILFLLLVIEILIHRSFYLIQYKHRHVLSSLYLLKGNAIRYNIKINLKFDYEALKKFEKIVELRAAKTKSKGFVYDTFPYAIPLSILVLLSLSLAISYGVYCLIK